MFIKEVVGVEDDKNQGPAEKDTGDAGQSENPRERSRKEIIEDLINRFGGEVPGESGSDGTEKESINGDGDPAE